MIIRFNTKEELLAALEERRKVAQKIDDEALAKHRKQEAAYLKHFHAACRAALKWDYETAKKHGFDPLKDEGSWSRNDKHPSCPESQVRKLDRVIAYVRTSRQEKYAITHDGVHSGIHRALMLGMPEGKGLC